jgi:hypothetical protein
MLWTKMGEKLIILCVFLCKKGCSKILVCEFNPLNAESNLICHLLILLGDLKFMGPCIDVVLNKVNITTCTVRK